MSNRAKVASIRARIAKLEAELTPELLAAAGAELNTDDVEVGDTVYGTQGKGDKERLVSGTVLAVVREPGKPSMFKLLSGSGASVEIVSLFPSQVTKVEKAVEEDEEQAVEGVLAE